MARTTAKTAAAKPAARKAATRSRTGTARVKKAAPAKKAAGRKEMPRKAAPKQRRTAALNAPMRLSHGTLEVSSLAKARPFFEEFLGLECVRHARRAMMIRKGGYWGVVCLEVGEGRVRPLSVRNHWGMDLESREAVDRAHALAHKHREKYGIRKIYKITESHGTYAFYFQDRDSNWWEFQHVDEGRYDKHYERGDIVEM